MHVCLHPTRKYAIKNATHHIITLNTLELKNPNTTSLSLCLSMYPSTHTLPAFFTYPLTFHKPLPHQSTTESKRNRLLPIDTT